MRIEISEVIPQILVQEIRDDLFQDHRSSWLGSTGCICKKEHMFETRDNQLSHLSSAKKRNARKCRYPLGFIFERTERENERMNTWPCGSRHGWCERVEKRSDVFLSLFFLLLETKKKKSFFFLLTKNEREREITIDLLAVLWSSSWYNWSCNDSILFEIRDLSRNWIEEFQHTSPNHIYMEFHWSDSSRCRELRSEWSILRLFRCLAMRSADIDVHLSHIRSLDHTNDWQMDIHTSHPASRNNEEHRRHHHPTWRNI